MDCQVSLMLDAARARYDRETKLLRPRASAKECEAAETRYAELVRDVKDAKTPERLREVGEMIIAGGSLPLFYT